MVDSSLPKDIMEKFNLAIAGEGTKPLPAGSLSALEARLRQVAEEAHKRETGQETYTPEEIAGLTQRIADSVAHPRQWEQTVKSADGKEYPTTIKYHGGRCEIVTDLYPQPFFIIVNEESRAGIPDDAWVYTLDEMLKILRLLRTFNGTVVSFQKRENATANVG